VVNSPFKVYFSDDDVEKIKKFLETKEGKKLADMPLRKVIRFIITTYIKDHS